MNALEVSQGAIEAWKRHDADALVAYMLKGEPTTTPAWTTL
jgi:hypothetical protein